MHALIDGDIIVYECGFASDAGAKADGLISEPLSYCLRGVNEKIAKILKDTGCHAYTVFLTGSPSETGITPYREEMFPDYKAHRTSSKPHWYKEIREHLVSKHSAIVTSDGKEADDALGITQTTSLAPLSTVICSKDKDLDVVPGFHYNWSKAHIKKGVYSVTRREALVTFYKQILTGDSTDNVPGLYRITGKKAGAKYLAPLDEMVDEREMYAYVREVYLTMRSPSGRYGCWDLTSEDSLDAMLLTLGTLLWIQQFRKEVPGSTMWLPPFGKYARTSDYKL